MLEIERKARLRDPAATERRLAGLAVLEIEEEKEDRYYLIGWSPGRSIDFSRDPIFRIRTSSGRAVLGWKKRSFTGTTEINEEREIDLGDPAAAVDWLEGYLGLEPFVVKRKRSRIYRPGGRLAPARIELNHVESLGDFLEVEVLSDDERAAVALIDEVFALLAVPPSDVETRYYIELLLGKECRR